MHPTLMLSFFLLAIVEGITEFLPISSTGHMIVVSQILRMPQTEFLKTFEIVIQLGAVLAIVALYWHRLLNRALWLPVILAFIPTAIVGFTLYPFIKAVLLESSLITIAALIGGGVVMLVLEHLYREQPHHVSGAEKLKPWQQFLVGCAQALAVVPGVSRAAATIIGGLFVGLKRPAAAEFSFLLALPTMMAASGLDLFETRLQFSSVEYSVLGIGFFTAFFTAWLTVRWFAQYVTTHSFRAFAWYRIVFGLVFFALLRF